MFKYNFLVLCYCILRVQGIDLEFSGCNRNGWLCQNATSGIGIDVTYRCTEEIEEENWGITWRYNGLPPDTESVTIENCNIELTLDTNLYSIIETKMDKLERVTKIFNDNLSNLRSIIIRNVKELKLETNFRDLLSKLRGNASVLFEDVQLINDLPRYMIKGPYPFIQKNKMESFNFTMKRVNIQYAEYHTVFWDKEYIPFFMDWENVNLEGAESPVEIVAPNYLWPEWSEIVEPQNNQVYIRNCTFKTMSDRTFILNTTVFQFTDNYVDTFEGWGFDTDSVFTNISGNTFNKINDFAFGYTMIGDDKNNLQFNFNIINKSEGKSLYFQEPHSDLDFPSRVSFHGNKFNCSNADWVHRSEEEADYLQSSDFLDANWYMKSFETLPHIDSDNFCAEYKRKVTVKDYTKLFVQYWKVQKLAPVV